jgi:hypothetical protein
MVNIKTIFLECLLFPVSNMKDAEGGLKKQI